MTKRLVVWLGGLLLVSALSACAQSQANQTITPTTQAVATATQPPPGTPPEPPLNFEIPDSELPLSEPGPYQFNMLYGLEYQDPQRENRDISIFIFYPSTGEKPDMRGAPFPLIISDYKMAYTFGTDLASHGYVVAGIEDIDSYDPWDENLFQQPLDYVFVLNQLAEDPPEILTGVIDTDQVGVWGYSFGGRNSVVLSGARIDPEYYLDNCENPQDAEILYGENNIQWMCGASENWDEFVSTAGPELTNSDDGMWQPITDERIRALMPLSAGNEWLLGPRGLAYADQKAILLTAGTGEHSRYEEIFRIYNELGTDEKIFITFKDQDHMMISRGTPKKQMLHLAVGFFGYHLKGQDDYGQYFSEDFISQTEGLIWGYIEE